LSFDAKYNEPKDIERNILNQLALIESDAGLDMAKVADTGPERLQNVLYNMHRATRRQVAVLVDEYDKLILDGLHGPELAMANRDYLRGFYGTIKGGAEHIRFVFVTGVSRFSKVSLFSGLNNLEDISLNPRFATICGYREKDLDQVFGPELSGLDRADMSSICRFDVGDIDIEALLFQTGYLTIGEERKEAYRTLYRLDCPNLEVRFGLNDQLMVWLGKKDTEPLELGRELCTPLVVC